MTLPGKLLPYPMPNQPGFWAYRKLDDGTLLETELTQEEWQALHDEALAEENARIDRLNEHPLNQAALELLRRAGDSPIQVGALMQMQILSLAMLVLPDADGKEDMPPWTQFAAWTSDAAHMQAGFRRLIAAGIEPGDLLAEEPREAAALILNELAETPS